MIEVIRVAGDDRVVGLRYQSNGGIDHVRRSCESYKGSCGPAHLRSDREHQHALQEMGEPGLPAARRSPCLRECDGGREERSAPAAGTGQGNQEATIVAVDTNQRAGIQDVLRQLA